MKRSAMTECHSFRVKSRHYDIRLFHIRLLFENILSLHSGLLFLYIALPDYEKIVYRFSKQRKAIFLK